MKVSSLRQVDAGVRNRSTKLSGYQDLTSPLRKSNMLPVPGHSMQYSWFSRLLMKPSL